MENIRIVAASTFAMLALSQLTPALSQASKTTERQYLIASETHEFKEKEGFSRHPKDIINTLKDNDVAGFSTLLDGLQQATDVGNILKNNGPYTLFAADNKAFKKLPGDDKQSLWANQTKLKQVLKYEIVFGQINAAALRKKSELKSLEGHRIMVSTKGDDIYVNGSLITTTDIPCTNGVIHIVDKIIMPPLSE